MRTIRPGRQRPGRVLFTSREQAGGLYPSGLSQNPPRQTGAGQSWHLISQSRLEPPFGASARRAHFYILLSECIRAPCGAAARIADGSPPQAACVAPLHPRGMPLAPLCGYPPRRCYSVFSLPVMRSMEPRRQACSTGRKAASLGLGGTPTRRIGKSKRISRCLACVCCPKSFFAW